jgi:hypothetical protein
LATTLKIAIPVTVGGVALIASILGILLWKKHNSKDKDPGVELSPRYELQNELLTETHTPKEPNYANKTATSNANYISLTQMSSKEDTKYAPLLYSGTTKSEEPSFLLNYEDIVEEKELGKSTRIIRL